MDLVLGIWDEELGELKPAETSGKELVGAAKERVLTSRSPEKLGFQSRVTGSRPQGRELIQHQLGSCSGQKKAGRAA
jgi:hypothetical protein